MQENGSSFEGTHADQVQGDAVPLHFGKQALSAAGQHRLDSDIIFVEYVEPDQFRYDRGAAEDDDIFAFLFF